MTKPKIALLQGGESNERDVSIMVGDEVFNVIDKDKYDVDRYDPKTDLEQFVINAMVGKYQLVIPLLYGPYGEDGKIQGMLDMMHCNYLFSETLASALAMNKFNTKIIAKNANLNVPRDMIITDKTSYDVKSIIMNLSLPAVVKPFELGSSVGISVVHTKEDLESAIKNALQSDSSIIIEEFVRGREFTVGVVGRTNPRTLPIAEIVPKAATNFNYKSKYDKENFDFLCPAAIPEPLKKALEQQALDIYDEVGCRDLARVDFLVTMDNQIYFLEINNMPGLMSNSLVVRAAQTENIDYAAFIDSLITEALK